MAPEGGELARSCAPATHNRVLLLHTQTRPPKRTLSRRGAVSCLWRARARTCFRCTYVYTRARTGPRTSLGLCALLDSRYPHAHRRTQVLVYIYIYMYERLYREQNGSSAVYNTDACLFPRVCLASRSGSLRAAPARACACRRGRVPAPVRTCVRVRASERARRRRENDARGAETGKERRERGQQRACAYASECDHRQGDNAIARTHAHTHTEVWTRIGPGWPHPASRHLASLTYDTSEPQGRQVAHKTKETREEARWRNRETR